MSECQEINSFFQKSGSIARHSFILKGITTSSSKCTSKLNLNGLLELLNITNDINLQIKIFSAISAHLMFNKGANIDVIIKCNAVYDKIYNVISRGLPGKSTEAFNFLSTLLYCDAEESTTKKRALALYARNMTRVSGCLSMMCEMFTNCMMYHDTWKALCQCTAVACSGCEINQSYCSHLIPVCIQKCSQANTDLLLVLQSLMLNHSRNTQLFLDCNGVSIFTRELLHYDKCLQLLMIVVQSSKSSTSLIQKTNVLADLRDFLRLYGPNSQLGQKAIIILNHISSSAKEKGTLKKNIEETKIHANNSLLQNTATENLIENDIDANIENDFEETKVLIQKVMNEINMWKQNEVQNFKDAESKPDIAKNKSRISTRVGKQNFACKRKPITSNQTNTMIEKRKNLKNNLTNKSRKQNQIPCMMMTSNELSFSFLQKDDFKVPKNKDSKSRKQNQIPCMMMTSNEPSFSFLQKDNFKVPKNKDAKCSFSTEKVDTQSLHIDDAARNDTDLNETILDAKINHKPTLTSQDFNPIFASTPKHSTESVNYTVNTQKATDEQTIQNEYKRLKMKRQKVKRLQQKEKGMKNRTLSARFFSAINESCTTLVKTVKNIFTKKESSNDSRSVTTNVTESSVVEDERQNTYSFINYMQKRDAILSNNCMKNKITDHSEVSTVANSCKTCDNTEFMKQKMSKDDFLKQTVKKLKLGINLYGCDFKKISKAMWPREKYMTPLVVYNLYRKLLLK